MPLVFLAFVSCSLVAGEKKQGSKTKCSGCLSDATTCIPLEISSTDEALCGIEGSSCARCTASQMCSAGMCSPRPTGNGGGTSTGGQPAQGGAPSMGGGMGMGGKASGGSMGGTPMGGSTPITASASLGATAAELNARQPDCNANNIFSLSCQTAAHRKCKAAGGFVAGFGPVEYNGGNSTGTVVCLGGGTEHGAAISALTAKVPGCTLNNLFSVECNAAIHRYCASNGFVSGVGVLETDTVNAAVFCFDSARATAIQGTFGDLAAQVPTCTSENRNTLDCRAAVNRKCMTAGYVSGFGPVEAVDQGVSYTCVK